MQPLSDIPTRSIVIYRSCMYLILDKFADIVILRAIRKMGNVYIESVPDIVAYNSEPADLMLESRNVPQYLR